MGDIFRDAFLGFIRAHVLWHACRERIFGAEMIEELRHHGHEVSPGTLYPILHAMQGAGLLDCESETEGGRVRKYYRATPEGRRALGALQEKIRELSREVLRPVPGEGPSSD